MAENWAVDVKKYAPDADDRVIAGIVRYCGIALRNRDSQLVSFSDPTELARVRNNYLKKKLGLAHSDEVLDEAIAKVGEVMKADRTKNRVTVYYLLAQGFDKFALFLKKGESLAKAPAKKAAAKAPAKAADAVKPAAKKVAAAKAPAKKATGAKAAAVGAAGVATLASIGTKGKRAAKATVNTAEAAVAGATGAAGKAGAAVAGAAGAVAAGASGAAAKAVDLAGDALSGAADVAGDVVSGAVDTAGKAGAAVAGAAGAAVAGVAGLASGAGDAVQGLIGDDKDGEGGSTSWLMWLLLLLLALFAIWWFFLRNPAVDAGKETAAAGSSATAVMPSAFASAPAEGQAVIPSGEGVTTEVRDGKPVVKVYFSTGKTSVPAALEAAAGGLKAYLDSNAGSALAVSGYNDTTGNAANNARLSKARAEAVKAAIVKAGAADASVELVKPANSTDTTVPAAAARRVEVTVK